MIRTSWQPTILVRHLCAGKVLAARAMVLRIHPSRKASCPVVAARMREEDDRRNGGDRGLGYGVCEAKGVASLRYI